MKKTIIASLFFLSLWVSNISAQETTYSSSENYGRTLNIGLGIGGYSGYYGYAGRSFPVLHLDYEIAMANSFTLAPFVNFYTYRNTDYRETVVPIGVKGTYYFDQILTAHSDWDFYLAGSLGFAIVNSSSNTNYHGNGASALFLDIHVGTEYHMSNRAGIFLDLSSGVSTIGLAIH